MNDAVARDSRYQYNGKELDEDFGLRLYAYGARYYDAVTGRFTGVDPIGDKFAHVTTYNYAENEPVANIDLHGLQQWKAQDGEIINGAYKNGQEAGKTTNGFWLSPWNNPTASATQQASSELSPVTAKNKDNVSSVSWGETQGVYPTKNTVNPSNSEKYDPTQWDEGKIQELLEARAGIDFIFNNRNDAAHTDGIDLNNPIENKLAPYHLKDNMPNVASEIKDNENVSFFLLADTPDAKHTSISSRYWNQVAVKSYGPFYNDGGGDAKKGQIFIIFYEAVRKF